MHFEILVEDQSGKEALAILVPEIIGESHGFRVHSYKGIGHIPKDMKSAKKVRNRMLLKGTLKNPIPGIFQVAKSKVRFRLGFIFNRLSD